MRTTSSRQLAAALWLIVLTVIFVGCSQGSPASPTTAPAAQPQAQPTQADAAANTVAPPAAGAAKSQPTAATSRSAPAAGDPQSRISESLNLLLLTDKQVLPSFHLEASGTEPVWNKDSGKIESQAFTFTADVSGDNIHFTDSKKGDKDTTTEGYIMSAKKNGGEGYSVENGKVTSDPFAMLNWAMLPLDWGLPLIYGAMGATSAGEESIDGRAADKFQVDSSKAPVGAEGLLKGFGLNVYSSKGTAWVDKQTGALLKMAIDYERDVQDTSGGGKVAGKGSGHIELQVTKVGSVTVNLPGS